MRTDLLADASTAAHLCGHRLHSALTRAYFSDKKLGPILHNLLIREATCGIIQNSEAEESDSSALKHALGFCEAWLLADQMTIDVRGIKAIQEDNSISNKYSQISKFFTPIEIPFQVQQDAANEVLSSVSALQYLARTEFDILTKHARESLTSEIQIKKSHIGILGNSTNTLERALYYFFLAPRIKKSLHIHPLKINLLEQFGHTLRKYEEESYNDIQNRVLINSKLSRDVAPLPPLADILIQRSKNLNCNLVDAAQSIHKESSIVELRERINHLVSIRNERGYLAYFRDLDNFCREIANQMTSLKSTDSIISRRIINFAELPLIGVVFKTMGGGQFEVPDILIRKTNFVGFFSRWANQLNYVK